MEISITYVLIPRTFLYGYLIIIISTYLVFVRLYMIY